MSARGPDWAAPGLYHYTRLQGEFPVRFHLRIDPDGAGLLLANASEAAHLSPVGVAMVRGALEGLDDTEIIQRVRADFAGGSVAQVTRDLEGVRKLLADLLTPEDNYPITNFGGAGAPAERRRLLAPHQAYVTQGEPAAIEPILRNLWEAGVPQVTLLAQPGLPPPQGLVRLVECAEDLGLIAGIRALASWLPEGVLRDAGRAGLDFLRLVLVSAGDAEHDLLTRPGDLAAFAQAVDACHDMELCPVAQVPLADRNADGLPGIVEFAVGKGIRTLSFFALACLDGEEKEDAAGALPARALPQVATMVAECAEECGARFLWDPPVRFDLRKALADYVIAGPRAGAEASIRVEPDGTVYAPRGPREPCGNLLRQSWDAIRKHPAFIRYRESVEAPSRCPACPGLALCAAACPKDPTGWSDDTATGEAT
jgi:radical SAM protein with 4Fe4S-binding SPASM domain